MQFCALVITSDPFGSDTVAAGEAALFLWECRCSHLVRVLGPGQGANLNLEGRLLLTRPPAQRTRL